MPVNHTCPNLTLGKGAGTGSTGQYTTLPGGFMIQWGQGVANHNANQVNGTINFPTAFGSTAQSVTATLTDTDPYQTSYYRIAIMTYNYQSTYFNWSIKSANISNHNLIFSWVAVGTA